jgi:NAD(P)-dependent dehydrogenase (short-subunit alcohol dehydrogenase family)
MASFDLTDRVAVVTGGSQGLGKATSLALARAGADVVVVARRPETVTVGRSRPHEPVDPVVEEVKALGRRAIGVTADVREEDQVHDMVTHTMSEFGKIDILVNVVGGSWGETFRSGPLLDLTPHDLIEAYRVNVVTMFMCSSAVAPIMKRQGKGVIVNIASTAGRGASPGSAAYGAAKSAVINMSMTMAMEWAPEVRVNSIAIGGIETPHRPMWVEGPQGPQAQGERSALGRLGTPEEHAGTVVWLASDYGGYITGAVIDANGGRRIG